MYRCHTCQGQAVYDFDQHLFRCRNAACGAEEPVTPRLRRCIRCGHPYTEYTWFQPSGCPNCGKTFVD
jgi:hypothetical protein